MATTTQVENKRRKLAGELARTADGYVPTPAYLAELLAGYPYQTLEQLPAGAVVLEPSAGTGPLVREVLDRNRELRVFAVEPDDDRAAVLDGIGEPHGRGSVTVIRGTLEDYAAGRVDPAVRAPQADAVIMNPPFSAAGQPRLWVRHVLDAFAMLRPGGRLSAILPSNAADAGYVPPGRDGKAWRDLVDRRGAVELVTVDRDAARGGFPRQVTLLRLVAPMPTMDGRPSWLLWAPDSAPVDVPRLDLGPAGALRTPVQRYPDGWDGDRLRVLRYVGTCHACARLLWRHDDRQDAQAWTVANAVEAEDAGMVGAPVGLCLDCGTDKVCVAAATVAGRAFWCPPVPDVAAMVDAAGLSKRLRVNVLPWALLGAGIGTDVQVIAERPHIPGVLIHYDGPSGVWSMAGRTVPADAVPHLMTAWAADPHGYPDTLIEQAVQQSAIRPTAVPAPADTWGDVITD